MRWSGGRKSENVEDRRGVRVSRGMMGGGIGTIILVLVALYFGVDPSILLNQGTTQEVGVPSGSVPQERSAEENRMAEFVSVVLADTEDTWHEIFRSSGKTYQEPKLVLFTDALDSACGFAQSAMGPNNGLLIYVLLADRDVEVVADRGFNGRVAAAEWAAVCEDMQREFVAGRYAEGVIAGVEDVGRIIGAHYPQRPGQRDEDELPNRPALL